MKTIIKAIIKIIALVFALKLLSPLLGGIANVMMAYRDNGQYTLIYSVSVLLLILIAALVLYFGWWKTDRIVRLIAGDLKENALAISTSNVDLYRVILSVLGIYLLATSVPNLFGLISEHFYYAQMYPGISFEPNTTANEIKGWVSQGVYILIGIWLTVGSKPIAKFFVRIWKQGW
jgi:hypothetical protein